jgi:RNA polymerase sigma factor (sigma-70 family)
MNTKNNNDRLIINHKYYQDLSKFDNLSQNEIKDLYSLIITGNTKATNTLIESNLKLVVHFAKQYKNYINQNEAFDIDDLISEGNIGLIKSIPKFNPELNVKFSFTLLFIEIYTRLLMNDVNQIRIPQNKIIAETKIRKEIDNLYQINQTEITDYDVSTNKFLPSEIEHYFNKPKANRIDKDEYFILDETQEDYADEIKHLITHYLKYLNKQETNKNVLELMNIN